MKILKYISILFFMILQGCSGGGTSSISPPIPPDNFFDPSDVNVVKSIKFEAIDLNNNPLSFINLTQIGSLVKYKIKIQNLNNFPMSIISLNFESNIYLEKNSFLDNCFNQNWYFINNNTNKMNLNIPANKSCNLYAISIWMENESNSIGTILNKKTISYEINNIDWGYIENNTQRHHIWCKENINCKVSQTENISGGSNVLVFKLLNLVANSYDFLQEVNRSSGEVTASINNFALNGNYIFIESVLPHYIIVKQHTIKLDNGVQKLVKLNTQEASLYYPQAPRETYVMQLQPRFNGDGAITAFGLGYPVENTKIYYANFSDNNYGMVLIPMHQYLEKNDNFVQSKDNKIWVNTSEKSFYKVEDYSDTFQYIDTISKNLSNVKNIVWSDKNNLVEADNNGNIISCYQKNNNYNKINSQGNVMKNTNLLAYDRLYVKKTNDSFIKYYDFNGNVINIPSNINIAYEFNPDTCDIANMI